MQPVAGAALVLAAVIFFGSTFNSISQSQADSVVSVLAESYGLQSAPPDQCNKFGTYWHVLQGRFLVPYPGPPDDRSLRCYSLWDDVSFLVDENTPPSSGVDYARLEADINCCWVP